MAYFFVSLPFCFIYPFYGIVLWTLIAFMNPQWYTWSVGGLLPWAQLVAIPTVVGWLLAGRHFNRLVSRETVLIAALWAWFTVTSVVSSFSPVFDHHQDGTWYQWQFVSKVLVMSVITVSIVNDFGKLRIYVLTIAASFGFFVLKAFPFIITTGGAFRLYGPPHSMIADNNDLGLALNMTLPLFFFLAQTESGWLKRLAVLLFVLTVPCIFFTYSRGALVGLLVVMTLMILRLKMRQRLFLLPVIALGIAVALLFAPAAWKERMDPTRPGAVDGSAQARLLSWEFARRLAADYPITGGGFDTFTGPLYWQYGYRVKTVHGPHSIYFEVLAEHGYVGLALYLTLIVSAFLTATRVIRISRKLNYPVLRHYADMCRFSLIGFLSSGVFLGRAYFDYYFAIVICLTILRKIAEEELAKAAENEDEPEEDAIESLSMAPGVRFAV